MQPRRPGGSRAPCPSSTAATAGSPRPDAAAYETWDETTRSSVWDEAIRIEDSVVISALLFRFIYFFNSFNPCLSDGRLKQGQTDHSFQNSRGKNTKLKK